MGCRMAAGIAQHVSGGACPGKEPLSNPPEALRDPKSLIWACWANSLCASGSTHTLRHVQGAPSALSVGAFISAVSTAPRIFWIIGKLAAFHGGSNLQWLKQVPPVFSAWGSWALQRWQKAFLASGCVFIIVKVIECVCVCGYIKSDIYWEGTGAPCPCSHTPKLLATWMALLCPSLRKYEGKKNKFKLILPVCFWEIFMQDVFSKNTYF